MCEISMAIYRDGFSEGERWGKKQGIDIGKRQAVSDLIRKNRITISEGAALLRIPESELLREI